MEAVVRGSLDKNVVVTVRKNQKAAITLEDGQHNHWPGKGARK